MGTWLDDLHDDPLPWLLDGSQPAVRHLALRHLLDRPADDSEVRRAREEAMRTDPIGAFLRAQHPDGWWSKPGPGYGPKYSSTVWSVIFLDQMGADGSDPRIRSACGYLLDHAQTASGGFGVGLDDRVPPPSAVVHCLNGNLIRALVGLGWLADERLQKAIEFQAAAVTGEGPIRFYRSSMPGPGLLCGANDGLPCAWGAAKALLGLARVPEAKRSVAVRHAIKVAIELLLSRDPAVADYPMGYGNQKPNGSWFKLGFPCGYVTDVLQVLEAVCEAGSAADERLTHAVEWLLYQQDGHGRWTNRYAYEGKMAADIERSGQQSRWVTLRACSVLKTVSQAERPA